MSTTNYERPMSGTRLFSVAFPTRRPFGRATSPVLVELLSLQPLYRTQRLLKLPIIDLHPVIQINVDSLYRERIEPLVLIFFQFEQHLLDLSVFIHVSCSNRTFSSRLCSQSIDRSFCSLSFPSAGGLQQPQGKFPSDTQIL